MKKILKEIFPLVLIAAVCTTYYFYIPKSVKVMNQRIGSSNPDILNEERFQLAEDLASYLAKGLPKNPGKTPTILHLFIGNQRKLVDLRIKEAIEEIKNTKVDSGEVRIWSIMNMGVVVKTENKIIAFDISDIVLSSVQKKLAGVADVFLVTHGDGDHYDPFLLKKALANGKSVVLPKDMGFLFGDNQTNLYHLEYDRETEVDGIKITAFQTDHRGDGNFMEPNAWYLVKVDGFTLLHTGDGMKFKKEKEKENLGKYNVDIFLANRKNHSYDVRDVSPKILVPLHLYKYVHNREELEQSTFTYVMDTYGKYENELKGIDIKPLFIGESFEYDIK